MGKVIFILFIGVFLSACAGNKYAEMTYLESQVALESASVVSAEQRVVVASTVPQRILPLGKPRVDLVRTAPPEFQRTQVFYETSEPVGTIVIDTQARYLYLVGGAENGMTLRYGIGVGREGFTWRGTEVVTRKAEWPGWTPPPEMRKRQPDLPSYMEGGPNNPLGTRALYLGSTLYRIHGTSEPWTIGSAVSSGCIRLTNEDVADLYNRVPVGTKVVVL